MTLDSNKSFLYGEYGGLRPYLEIPDGWLYKVGVMIKDIETYCIKNKIKGKQIKIEQIKEKYNTLRVYFFLEEDVQSHYEAIQGIVDSYSKIVDETCEFCGCTQSKVRSRAGARYIMCEECAEERGFGG